MIVNHKFGTCLTPFGSCADRYCLNGYGGGVDSMEKKLELATQIKNLDGLELVSNWHVNDSNVHEIQKMFKDHDLQVCMLVPDLWTQAKWGRGSFAAPDKKTRQEAVDEVKRSIDWAAILNCPYVDVWPGQDGYDYCFQADFSNAWNWLREGLAACSEHSNKVKVLVEYKMKEPRTHCFVNSAAKTILLLQDLDNVGVLLDVGHSMAAGENIAEAATLLDAYGKLDYLHLNDNYRSWDDDMMVGAVHIVEYLELIYWLKRLNYEGWLTLDIFPYRENGVRAIEVCRKWIEGLYNAIDRVGMDSFANTIKSADACNAMDLVRRAMKL